MRTLQLAGTAVPVIGQGTWRMGENPDLHRAEVFALREGLDLGMRLIDTAEMYADGNAEVIVGHALDKRREQAFVVSKVYPHNASRDGIPAACERSLKRLDTDYIDLYLLHWRGQYPLEETVEAFERLREAGKIRHWGVSNFDVADLLELDNVGCATNQVLYNPESRGIEYDLLPWMNNAGMPLMAYCPIGQGADLLLNPAMQEVARRHDVTPAQVSLAWVVRQPGVVAIPKATSSDHVQQNAAAAGLTLDADDLQLIESSWPAPTRKRALSMV